MLDIDDIVSESRHAYHAKYDRQRNRQDFLHTLIGSLCVTGFMLVFILLVLAILSNDDGSYCKLATFASIISLVFGLTYIFMPH